MVGSINAPLNGSNTFEAFQAAAKSASGTPGVRPMSIFDTYLSTIFYSYHFLQQNVGFLVGIGASASVPVGPIPSGVTTFGAPTPGADPAIANGSATGSPSATGSSVGSAATPSATSGAPHVVTGSIFALLAAALGLAMA